ncbi:MULTISPECIES: 2-phosphosulfolactate phosphatase [unclassified Geobacillus]|uniref:Probable 2-phosphosulfolactate phosphatase n=1 Tax=Geobacillus sp. (strain WCH70) TaxID=471223 RepID=C5D810_GEOSW|nr:MULTISPECIES: 2-phosphosulfolactate phosphatase [unclassified Geobacillus]PUF88781.1 2-phosphosulfolactate phosphatase [Geobacillus sp. LYN3]RDV21932.1 2-phosphosulfolactate phosphatase [Parageobacillus toebii]TXK87869.1 2-phosphosulfolactate phosphatase [Geobacillus sp. AYS3]
MAKVHVVFRKEDIDETALADGKIAVVFDILLATSTITAALSFGAASVIPVRNAEEAREKASLLPNGSYELVGEYEGRTIDGFRSTAPLFLQKFCPGKTIILSTTNGTVAIRKAMNAKHLYVGSLLNGRALAEHICRRHSSETIVAICSGSSGRFCLEDFYGAGYFISCLLQYGVSACGLSDAAMVALLFYEKYNTESAGKTVLASSRVGRWMMASGLESDLDYINQQGALSVIPVFQKTLSGGEIHDATRKKAVRKTYLRRKN